jgi:ABC-type dipeptide/oligopeptide/nickel transport system permease component
VNGSRSALFSGVATAIAIFVVVFGLAAALGELGNATQVPSFEGKLIGEIAARLPVTLEPVLISFFVASALGFVLTLPAAPAFRVAVAVIVTGLRSIPLFVVATIGVLMFFRMPRGSCLAPCTFGIQLAFLVMPVVVLTVYQLPFLVKFFDGRRARVKDTRVFEMSTVGGLAILFADRLPSLISAAMIGEFIYRWAGEGRWLGVPDAMFGGRDASEFTLFLIFNALVVLVIRCMIEFFVQRHRTVTDVGG